MGQSMHSRLNILQTQCCFCFIAYSALVMVEQKSIVALVENSILFCFAAVVIYKNIPHEKDSPIYLPTYPIQLTCSG